MRLLGYLFLILLLVFAAWPYYHLYRLDDALGRDDPAALADLIDVDALRGNYKKRLEQGFGLRAAPSGSSQNPSGALLWLQDNLQRMGDAALEQTITLDWARDSLKQATAEATTQRPPYLLAAVEFAFFESYDSFIVRLGELGVNATHVRLRLQQTTWRVTDIIR
jgi:hypothetical protein